MSNVVYTFSSDGCSVYGVIPDGTRFCIDADMLDKVKDINFYRCRQGYGNEYLMDCKGNKLHDYLFPHRDGFEVDHINLNTFDNRRRNIRYCTHQQNQMNQPLQKNNTSGVSGVSWYEPRNKYRARIKISQQEIHLGYYDTFMEAVQARNVGMECMFGEYGRYNDVPTAPADIRKQVIEKCKRFADLSVCEAFFVRESGMTENKLTLGSLFDGSAGFPLGGLISGITPLWASEVEPFPIRVTTKRLPQMQHLGDVSSLNGAELPPVDIITFGSPCQDMSMAGKRTGLNGSRSCLFYEAVRIVKEMRCKTDGKYPRFVVWENVPGAFSSNKGEDFKAVLEAFCGVKDEAFVIPEPDGKWENAGCIMGENFSIAWRVFDAQHWGVPQRRKRIYLVADFADRCAGKILFESEGVSGYSPQGFKSWQGATGSAEESLGASSLCLNDQGGERMDVTKDITATLRAASNHPPLVFENHSQDTRYKGPLESAPTVLSTYGTGGNNQPFVLEDQKCFDVRFTSEGTRNARQNCYETETSRTIDTGGNTPDSNQGGVAVVAYGICSKESHSMQSDNPHSGFYKADTARCLDANGGNPSCNQGGIAVIEGNGSRPSHKGDGYKESEVMYTLNATEQHAVAFADVHAALSANDGPKGPSSQMLSNPEENFAGEPAYGIDRSAYNQGANAKFGFSVDTEVEPPMVARGAGAVAQPIFCTSKSSYHTIAEKELANTLVATDYKDPPIINGTPPEYIVRRLTPTECARLQGFPDWWCDDLGTDDPTEEEIAWWTEVFVTHARVMGKSTKPKTRNQIVKWLKDPYSDAAAYKMWGNGVALPNVCFVLAGIVYYAQETTE